MEQICFLTSTREREATFSKWSCSVGAGAGYDCVTTYFNGRDDNLRVVKSCVAGGGQIYPPGTYNLDPDQQAPLAFFEVGGPRRQKENEHIRVLKTGCWFARVLGWGVHL